MRWIAQVGHVARKDVRQVSLMLLLYVVMIAVAASGLVTGKAFGPYSTMPNNEILAMPDSFAVILPMLLVVLGVLSAAALVQLDSPTRPNAFWTTRPLSPSAVLTSKLLVTVGGIIGLTLVGAFVALRAMDVSAAMMTRILLATSLSAGEWALMVLVLVALTGDLRGFVVALVATILGLLFLLWFVDDYTITTSASIALSVLSIASALWFVFRLYRTHERRRVTWVAGFVIAGALIVASFDVPQPIRNVPVLNQGAPLQIAASNPSGSIDAPVPIKLRVAQIADSERVDFSPDSVVWKLPNGTVVHSDLGAFSSFVVGGALPWIGRTVRWINVDSTTLEWPSILLAGRPERYRDTTVKMGSVMVDGMVTVSRSHIIASMPLKRDALFIGDGRRLRLYGGEEHNREVGRVWIQLSTIRRPGRIQQPNDHLSQRDNLQFALVNDERGEAMMIDGPTDGAGSASVVLPQINMSTWFNVLSTATEYSPKGGVARDDNWYKGARLVVIEWSVVGRYRSVGEAKVEEAIAR